MKEVVGMRHFKYIFIAALMVFSSCDKDEPTKEFVSYADKPFTCCTEFTAATLPGDSVGDNITRGWEGELPSGSENLPLDYPLNEIFLVVKNPKGKYETLSFPVYSLDEERRVFDICFRAEGKKLWAMSGEQEILVADGNSFTCNFYSSDQLSTSMEIGDVKTPGNQRTYDPYGDKLFKSDDLSFHADGNQVKINGTPLQNFSLTVNRITNVLIPRFILCDDLEANKNLYELTEDRFVELLGPVTDWSIRAFIAGDEEAGKPFSDGFPVEYSFQNGTDENGKRGLVSISPDVEPFHPNIEHAFIQGTGGFAIYRGVGFHNTAAPYIFPANTAGNADVCFCIYYNGSNPDFKKVNTFRIEALTDLVEGQLKTVTIVIDVDDFVKAFKETSSCPDSRISIKLDKAFGEVTEVPYKLISE